MFSLRIASLLMILLVVLPLARAQHTLATVHLIERVAKEKEPMCKLSHISVSKNQEENYAYLIWRCDGQEVRVDVNEYASVKDAKITSNSLTTAAYRATTRLSGIGDEAFILGEGSYSKGRFNVIFRKGRVRMNITAPSADMAQRFAKHLADSVPAAEQANAADRG